MLEDRCNDHAEIIEQAEAVLKRQKGKKWDAINRIVDAYRRLVRDIESGIKYWQIVELLECSVCGTTLMRRRSPLGLYTADGDPIYYCLKCKKVIKRWEVVKRPMHPQTLQYGAM